MSLVAVIVKPPPPFRGLQKRRYCSFLPVLEQELIRNICFKNFETYILPCQIRNIYFFKKVKIFRREHRWYIFIIFVYHKNLLLITPDWVLDCLQLLLVMLLNGVMVTRSKKESYESRRDQLIRFVPVYNSLVFYI